MPKISKWEIKARSSLRFHEELFLVRKLDGYVFRVRNEAQHIINIDLSENPKITHEHFRLVKFSKDWKGVCQALEHLILSDIRLQNQSRVFVGRAQDPIKFTEMIEESIKKLRKEIEDLQ